MRAEHHIVAFLEVTGGYRPMLLMATQATRVVSIWIFAQTPGGRGYRTWRHVLLSSLFRRDLTEGRFPTAAGQARVSRAPVWAVQVPF